jgi:uncharacterized SAM-dependent methyltransferase
VAYEIIQGLLATPASISPKYFYDERSSNHFEIVDRWFRTESGEMVIAQFPNWP